MSAVGNLAAELAEYGGPWHTHGGWLARDTAGHLVDGYRYARRERHTCGGDCDRTCDGWHWRYSGRAFASEDAVTVLAELVARAAR